MRVGGHCMQRGGDIRRAVTAGSGMQRDRADTAPANTGHAKIK
jgi:hypothetical protein